MLKKIRRKEIEPRMRQTVDKIKEIFASTTSVFVTNGMYHLPTLAEAPEMTSILCEIQRAFEKGIFPERVFKSSTETYFLKDCEHQPIAVFKPHKQLEEGIREVAAYQLDHLGFARVPPTVLTTLSHSVFNGPRTGTCQKFIEKSRVLSELEDHMIVYYSAAQIRRIATLDIRLLNNDRHASNLLISDGQLFPIDHAISFPRKANQLSLVWVEWPQAQTPFSTREKEYISSLSPEADRECLLKLGIDQASADLHFLATLLLKIGVSRGWTAADLGLLLLTPLFHSVLEEINMVSLREKKRQIERLLDNETGQCKNKSTSCGISRE